MSILRILAQNLRAGSRTRRPADVVPQPERLRGTLVHEATACVACQSCAYVCSPGAIRFDAGRGQATLWEYFAGQCAYCGRCVDYCPTGALRFEPRRMPVTGILAELKFSHPVPFQTCGRCGKPFTPLPEQALARTHGDPLPEAIAATRHLCEACRRLWFSERLKGTLVRNEPPGEKGS